MTREEAHEKYDDLGYRECPDIGQVVDDIYDDFESHTCENCKYGEEYYGDVYVCTLMYDALGGIGCFTTKDFGCNKFKAKD